jgi:hypothetical protein
VACAKLASIHLEDFLVMTVTIRSSFYTSHCFLSCEPLGAGSIRLPVLCTQRPH